MKRVNIRSTGFAPRTVTIAGGDTVEWKNVDTVNHQVVANSGAFASGQIRPNGIYRKRIDTPGTYPYHDALFPARRGTVRVTGNPPSVSIAASLPIAIYGDNIHVSGAISPAAVNDVVSVQARPVGQASFVEIGEVRTTTNGVWDFITSPTILTTYRATWKGKTSAEINVAVSPRLSLTRVSGWFVTKALPAKYGGNWVYVQRMNRFGDWVSLRKITYNRQSAKRFKMRTLPRGLNRLRVFMGTSQAGSGYFRGASPTLTFRRR